MSDTGSIASYRYMPIAATKEIVTVLLVFNNREKHQGSYRKQRRLPPCPYVQL